MKSDAEFQHTRQSQRLAGGFRLVNFLVGLLLMSLFYVWVTTSFASYVSIRMHALYISGTASLLLAAAGHRLPLRMALGLTVFLTFLPVVLVVTMFLKKGDLQYADRLQRETKRIGIWQFDDRYGYSHLPRAAGRHEHIHKIFDVTYTIDDRGWRVTPDPALSEGSIAFLGCSFTFGYGLEDVQAFPYVLGREYWPRYKVENRAVSGWGTAHALLSVQDMLRSNVRPSMVVYGAIPGHIERNSIRKSWIRFLNLSPQEGDRRGHPHIEVVDGSLVNQGVCLPDEGLDDSPELSAKELALTGRYIREMHRLCSREHIRYIVVLLPTRGRWPAQLFEELVQSEVPILNLMHLPMTWLPNDEHPSAEDARKLARAIGESSNFGWMKSSLVTPPQ